MRLAVIPAAMLCILLPDLSAAQDVEGNIKLISTSAPYVGRSFGAAEAESATLFSLMTSPVGFNFNGDTALPVLGLPGSANLAFITKTHEPVPLHIGPPLIQTKALIKVREYLYIADTGKDSENSEPAKIWRLHPETGELTVFFTGDLLVNAKWITHSPATDKHPEEIIVSDYGVESSPREPGTGEGAKVFAIPINEDGSAGTPRVLHSGPPFRSPEGIVVVGNTVVVADWAAGDPVQLESDPSISYPNGTLFSLPLSGGEPVRHFSDQQWVVLIGVYTYAHEGKQYLGLIDLDRGRPDDSELAYLPQSGTPGYFRAEITGKDPITFGELERINLMEDSLITLAPESVDQGAILLVRPQESTQIVGHESEIRFDNLSSAPAHTVLARSPVNESEVKIQAELLNSAGNVIASEVFNIPKVLTRTGSTRDPKAAASLGMQGSDIFASADGTTGSVYLYSQSGSVAATVWLGAPLNTPIGLAMSDDRKSLFVADQSAGPDGTGSVWTIPLPTQEETISMFSDGAVDLP